MLYNYQVGGSVLIEYLHSFKWAQRIGKCGILKKVKALDT